MSEVGALPLRTIKTLLVALDDPDLELHELLGVAHRAVGRGTVPVGPDAASLAARKNLARYVPFLKSSRKLACPPERLAATAVPSC